MRQPGRVTVPAGVALLPEDGGPDRDARKAKVPLVKLTVIFPAAACVLSLAACASTSVSRTSAPASAASAAALASSQAAPPSSSPSPSDSTTGSVGDTFTLTDSTDGWSYTVTLVKVLDPAEPDNSFDAADSGKRLVGAEFKLTGVTGTDQDDANSDAAIQGSDSQLYSPTFSGLAAGTNFNSGEFSMRPGVTEVGWVTFEVPDGVKVAQVQWNPSLIGNPATWVIGS